MTNLSGKTAIITGAAQGIGLGIAATFADYGARVVLTDINAQAVEAAADELRNKGADATAIAHDVTDPASSTDVVREVVKSHGSFDVFVNNAGIAVQVPFDQLSEEQWDTVSNVNLRGLFFACQAAGTYFKGKGEGNIVNLSSFAGRKAVEEYSVYNATKAAVVMLTQTLALELGPHNVNVNAVCPGIVKTPIWDTLDPEQWARQEMLVPLRRGQTVEDIAEAVAFLASPQARNITGATIPVTGGLAMW